MEYKVEEPGQLKRKIIVTVPAEEVDTVLNEMAAKYRLQVSVPGFRKGKVPLNIVEKQFGREIVPEATKHLLETQAHSIIDELKLEPASNVSYDAGQLGRGREFGYSFSFEYLPEFTLPEYEGFPLEQEEAVAEEHEVDEAIERIRSDLALLKKPEEKRLPKDGDMVYVDLACFDMEGADIPELTEKKVGLRLGRDTGLPDLENIIKTLHENEEGEGEVTFPESFAAAKVAGSKARVKVKLHGLFELALPAVDDELAKKVGKFESMADLRAAVFAGILERREQIAQGMAQKRLLDELLKLTDFPLPEGMVEQQVAKEALAFLREEMGKQGGKAPENIAEAFAKAKADARVAAEHLVRANIFLHRASKAENIEVSGEDIMLRLQVIAAESGRSPEEVRREYIKNNLLAGVHDRIMADKAMQAIYAKAKVTYIKSGIEAGAGIKAEEAKKAEEA
ncbi:MAG: trigger factor [Deltaproteobacteria bacterium]|jgi:trigger factor|nr:trigger factor [Deltaproteobacteria bacterium]